MALGISPHSLSEATYYNAVVRTWVRSDGDAVGRGSGAVTARRRKARSTEATATPWATTMPRTGAAERAASRSTAAFGAAEPEALAVSHWFDTEPDGAPYTATIRFSGRRLGIRGKPTPRDTFAKEETIDGVLPGSGRVSITTWVYGLEPGEWTVTAELIRRGIQLGARRPSDRRGHGKAQSLPRAVWSWPRWALSSGGFTPVKTRWAPLVRLARMPAVIPGSWSGLIGLGALAGVLVQAAILTRVSVSVSQALLVDLLAVLSGLLGAKVLYVALRRRSWRQSIGEGWSVDGFLLVTPIVAGAALLALNLPIGVFLDASAPALFFGVAIGRLGCFFTGCCAGRCTSSRWGVWSSDRRVGARRIPTQLFESATGLLIGATALLLVLNYAPSADGIIFVVVVSAYVLVRQLLLRLRSEPHNLARARLTAGAAAMVLASAAVMLVARPS